MSTRATSPLRLRLTAASLVGPLVASALLLQTAGARAEAPPVQAPAPAAQEPAGQAPTVVAAPTAVAADAVVAPSAPGPAEEREEAPSPPGPSRVPAYVTLGLAGAGLVAGSFFGVRALGAQSDYDEAPSRRGLDRVETNALLSDMAFALGLTLGITGTVLLFDEPAAAGTRAAGPRLVASPYATPQGGGAQALLRF